MLEEVGWNERKRWMLGNKVAKREYHCYKVWDVPRV